MQFNDTALADALAVCSMVACSMTPCSCCFVSDISNNAWLLAWLAELNYAWLQVVRLSSQDVPTAYAFELEAATIVQPEEVANAVQRVVAGAPVLA